jgi:hypothetical protein
VIRRFLLGSLYCLIFTGLIVKTIHTDNMKKYKVLGLSKLSANNEKFELNDFATDTKRIVSVTEYFEITYGPLKYSFQTVKSS